MSPSLSATAPLTGPEDLDESFLAVGADLVQANLPAVNCVNVLGGCALLENQCPAGDLNPFGPERRLIEKLTQRRKQL